MATKEYVRDHVTPTRSKATISIFKRGMKGVYRHCGDFICTAIWLNLISAIQIARLGVDDGERAAKALKGIEGKRLTYRIPSGDERG